MRKMVDDRQSESFLKLVFFVKRLLIRLLATLTETAKDLEFRRCTFVRATLLRL